MKLKFNKYERMAGLFVFAAALSLVGIFVVLSVKQGWFVSRVQLKTSLEHADGVNPGTVVQMSGLRVGSVESVELLSDSRVEVKFNIMQNYLKNVREDSRVRVVRTFVIGDKVLDVTIGRESLPQIKEGATLENEEVTDLVDLLGGRRLGPFIKTMDALLDNFRRLAEAFVDPRRTQDLIELFDIMKPMAKNVNTAAYEVTLAARQMSKNLPEMGPDTTRLLKNLVAVTDDLNKILPALSATAPDIPAVTKRAVEAINEATIVLKAMQKSFLLRSSAQEVREEEAKERKPAHE